MTRFGILDDEPETCVSPTLQLLNRVSAAANVSSSMLGTSYLGNGTHSPAHLRRPPSSTPKRSLKPPALAQPQTTPGHSVKSKDKRDFVDTVRLLSSPLAAKESHALQDAAWVRPCFNTHIHLCTHPLPSFVQKSTEHKAESMRLFFENMAVSNGAPPKPTMKNQADPFTVLESDIAGQRTALERTMNQKCVLFLGVFKCELNNESNSYGNRNSEIELKKKELLDKNAQMETVCFWAFFMWHGCKLISVHKGNIGSG